ncbi:hypothetical protein OHB35_12125 [Streptomyces phaeochromogenes]|uniref:Uncharacterized protein n=1 Tax=Streptomyces phaeochromogenes TaxID=1923 RepID=A0ABZ1H6Y6_STRPH|nr:hypothetical protein [Streptomyces phaeochromogenes]WSD13925.1 hypothetical protein OHB35_12125 [Streptomyces phaeochromogenes]
MGEPRQSSPSAGTDAGQGGGADVGGGAVAALRKLTPPPALCGFLLLLALMFMASYAAGAAVGPVAPGMHETGTSRDGDDGGDGGGDSGGGGMDMDMGGTHGSDGR